jgi:serine protease Do
MAVTNLQSKFSGIRSVYRGKVIVIDVMTNNPGAAGGALIDLQGRLVGLIGKELRDEQSGIWINYSIPVDVLTASIERINSGKTRTSNTITVAKNPHKAIELGLVFIPDVIPKTPAFVDQVRKDSLANKAGILPNDLILMINEQRIDSQKSLEQILLGIERSDSFQILVQRDTELVRTQIRP